MLHLLVHLPAALGGPTSTAAGNVPAGAVDPVDALTKSGQNLVDSAKALAAVWMLLVLMGVGVALLFRRGAKLTATVSTVVLIALASILIFTPDWVLSVIRGLGFKVTA